MFGKRCTIVLVGIALLVPAASVHAQLLEYDQYTASNAGLNRTDVTVGTTTYSVEFAQATLNDAQARLREILNYIRNNDSFNAIDVQALVASTTPAHTNPYTFIADYVFEVEQQQQQLQQLQGVRDVIINAIEDITGFDLNFELGDEHPGVTELQRFLNQFPETRIAEEGAGAPGQETDYFGPRTRAAVERFQELHKDEILAPLGLQNPTGFWGAASRAIANKLLNR